MADYNFDAGTAGWEDGEHSDFKELDYIDIYEWYRQFFASPGAGGTGPTAIAIGQE